MDRHLADNTWFSSSAYGIADIALYAYTHVAEEGDFNLVPYRNLEPWFERVRAQPNHIRLLQETSALPVMSLEEDQAQRE